ncbi:MAG: RagB/SusD family nutrient uptake outer membrane protein [Gemmatimonadota bacterium]|nr:RagB/SusD family nutrient uptake outer membrane protein [Gemmatimonadota bacterium]
MPITTWITRLLGSRLLPLALLTLLSSACDTEGLLDVDLPGNVEADDVEAPAMATVMRNSAIGDFECVWDSYVTQSALHSDEYLPASGNITAQRSMLRQITPDFTAYAQGSCAGWTGIFTPMHTARFMLESHYDRLQGFTDEEVPERQQYMAEMRAYAGFTYVAFGEGYCGTPIDAGDEILTPEQLLDIAVSRFTDALDLAQQAGNADLVDMARVGRARANLDLENYEDAISDAELVTEGFEVMATREAQPSRRQNTLESINRLESNRSGTVAPSFRDLRWKGEEDPRVNVVNTGFVGHDNASIIWRHDKVETQGDDRLIASYREARLFLAEAAAMTNDLDRAIGILQDLHDEAGIPTVTEDDLPTQDAVIEHVIEERKRELFVEGGHRLRDHLRWRGTPYEVPFLGEPGSDHPDGTNDYGQPYGTTTCYPVPNIEST